jgi:hypothetical protein
LDGGGWEELLKDFEEDMLGKVRGKVERSREAVGKLHGREVLTRSNQTRGSL